MVSRVEFMPLLSLMKQFKSENTVSLVGKGWDLGQVIPGSGWYSLKPLKV